VKPRRLLTLVLATLVIGMLVGARARDADFY